MLWQRAGFLAADWHAPGPYYPADPVARYPLCIRAVTWHRSQPHLSARHAPKAPTGIEPVEELLGSLEPKIRLYVEHFRALGGGDSS